MDFQREWKKLPLDHIRSSSKKTVELTTSSTINVTAPVKCQDGPKFHLLFLKTHKTGSSTVQNILERFAFKNNILVGLAAKTHMFGYSSGTKFNRKMLLPVPKGRRIGMLMHHMVFNYEEVSAVLPSDSFYFTILRDPATQFESAFRYFSNVVRSFSNVDLATWINNAEKFFHGRTEGNWFLTKNGMFFDLGFNSLNESDIYIESSIAKMDKMFDFVMIAEYFDISLILLKDLLCWKMEDILSLTQNSRKHSKDSEQNVELQKKIRKWNKADTMLYNHYNKTLWRRIEEYGKERLEKDLKEFQEKKKKLKEFCVEDKKITNEDITDKKFKVYNPKGVSIEQYQLRDGTAKNETCVGLVLPELSWDRKLRRHFYNDSRDPWS